MTSTVYQTYSETAAPGSIRHASPDPFCKHCKGTGVNFEHHPWGETYATETLMCSCVDAMLSDVDAATLVVIPLYVKIGWENPPGVQVMELLERLSGCTRYLMSIRHIDAHLSPLYMERCKRARMLAARVDQIIERIDEMLMAFWADKISIDVTCADLRYAALTCDIPKLNLLSGRVVGLVSLNPVDTKQSALDIPF